MDRVCNHNFGQYTEFYRRIGNRWLNQCMSHRFGMDLLHNRRYSFHNSFQYSQAYSCMCMNSNHQYIFHRVDMDLRRDSNRKISLFDCRTDFSILLTYLNRIHRYLFHIVFRHSQEDSDKWIDSRHLHIDHHSHKDLQIKAIKLIMFAEILLKCFIELKVSLTWSAFIDITQTASIVIASWTFTLESIDLVYTNAIIRTWICK